MDSQDCGPVEFPWWPGPARELLVANPCFKILFLGTPGLKKKKKRHSKVNRRNELREEETLNLKSLLERSVSYFFEMLNVKSFSKNEFLNSKFDIIVKSIFSVENYSFNENLAAIVQLTDRRVSDQKFAWYWFVFRPDNASLCF